jgi:uncharacterized protein YaaQ
MLSSADDLERALHGIGSSLEHDVSAYLIGGCAMILYNAKLATKDVDLVLTSDRDAAAMMSALSRNGFSKVRAKDGAYLRLGTTVMMENDRGIHIDVFVETVCRKLMVTDSMISRSMPYAKYGRLSVSLISPEDIFLFKSMTERAGDLGDMALLAERGLDWKAILDECTLQSHDEIILEGYLAVRLQELEDEFGVVSPIKGPLEAATEDKMLRRRADAGESNPDSSTYQD